MEFEKYYIVANTREEFENESKESITPYSDHPSQRSINYIIDQLALVGYKSEYFGGTQELITACYKQCHYPNTLFLNFSDGLGQISRKAQSAILLELLDVPYAGSDPLARLMAGNKAYAKTIVSSSVDVPSGVTIFNNSNLPTSMAYPVIVKPNREGSSLGITQDNICFSKQQLSQRATQLLQYYPDILVEEYIPGYEITCFIIGNKNNYYLTEPLLCEYQGEQYFNNFVFGLEEKATRKRKEYLAKKILPPEQIEKICKAARISFEVLNMHDFARVDFRLQKDGRLVFLEINGNAVISETSELGTISHELGIPFGELVGYIIKSATDRIMGRCN